MPAATSKINLKVDPVGKERAKRVFDELGLDMSTAINLFLRQVIRTNGIPFPLTSGRQAGYVDPALVYTANVTDAGVVVPADWDDPEDAVYDERYGD